MSDEIDAALGRAEKTNSEPVKNEISLFSLGQHQEDQDKHIDLLRSEIRDFRTEVRTDFDVLDNNFYSLNVTYSEHDKQFDSLFLLIAVGITAIVGIEIISIVINYFIRG